MTFESSGARQKISIEALSGVDHKGWAKRLQARHDRGDKLNPNQVRCYRNALGLNVPMQ